MADVTNQDSLADVRRAYVEAQLAGDRRKALDLVAGLANHHGLSHGSIRAGVIRAAQQEIGRLWQENRISVAQEHMATAISHLALAELFRHERPAPRNGRKVIVACVDGELHDFPARFVADELDIAGFDVRFLGASVPTDTLLTFVAREEPDLLVLSATMAFHADTVRDAVERIRRRTQGRLPIAVGGQVCDWVESFGRELGVEIAGSDGAALVEQARTLLGVRRS
jgi:methanogenic corrinoid protein MtbC1